MAWVLYAMSELSLIFDTRPEDLERDRFLYLVDTSEPPEIPRCF
jgi:hypothetical protein